MQHWCIGCKNVRNNRKVNVCTNAYRLRKMNKRNEDGVTSDRQNIKKCKMRTVGHLSWVRAASKPVWP